MPVRRSSAGSTRLRVPVRAALAASAAAVATGAWSDVATAETQHSGGDGGGAGEVDEEAARAHPSEVFSEDVDAEPPRAAESEGYSPAVAAIAKPFRWVGTALSTTHRVAVLGAVFAPALLTAPLFHYVLPESWRPWHSELVVSSCELAGGMFLKLGQWASHREDMFPAHLCAALRRLRENVPCHSSEVSAQTVEAAFGAPLAAVFREFEVEALASGAIAQVHRAVLHSGQQVAVKVRHPDVEWRLEQDTRILFALCNGLATLPGLGFLGIPTSVDEFARSVQAQTDLSHEASNLLRFRRNFGLDAPGAPALDVDFPRPVAGLVSPSALVLSWEGGETIQRYIDERHPANKRLAQLGYDVFMTMILVHNFAHADCHAGNIFVRGDFEANKAADARPRLVVLDAGLVSRLSRPSKENLVKLLAHVVRADGRRAADMFLYMSSVRGSDEEGFRASMAELFARECAARPVKVGALISHTMQLVRAHGLRLDSEFASVIVSMTLLEGLATALDPEIDLVRGLAPFVLRRPAAVLRGLAASPSERFLPRMRSRARSHPTPESLDLLWH